MIKTKQLQIDAYDSDTVHVVTLNVRVGNKLNKTFPTYMSYTIKEGEEPLFSIRRAELGKLAAILPKAISKATLEDLLNSYTVNSNTED